MPDQNALGHETDILTPREFKLHKIIEDPTYYDRLRATVMALARFAKAADMPLTDAEVAEFFAARKPLMDKGWLP